MKVITHLQVGNKDYVPTTRELSSLASLFQKVGNDANAIADLVSSTCDTIPVVAKSLYLNTNTSKLAIAIGSTDWKPTHAELDDCVDVFSQVLSSDEPNVVVVTRFEIHVEVVDKNLKVAVTYNTKET